jgi:hypothetical protein
MEKTMEIRQIKMASCRQDVIISGELSSGNFQYESSIVINTSDLNRLINLLQKGNPSDEISAMFTSTDWTEYVLNTKSLGNKTILLSDITDFKSLRRICA